MAKKKNRGDGPEGLRAREIHCAALAQWFPVWQTWRDTQNLRAEVFIRLNGGTLSVHLCAGPFVAGTRFLLPPLGLADYGAQERAKIVVNVFEELESVRRSLVNVIAEEGAKGWTLTHEETS